MSHPVKITSRHVADFTNQAGAYVTVDASTAGGGLPETGWRCYGCGKGGQDAVVADGTTAISQARAHANTCTSSDGR